MSIADDEPRFQLVDEDDDRTPEEVAADAEDGTDRVNDENGGE